MRKYLIENIKINIDNLISSGEREVIINKLHLTEQKVKDFKILRKSLDARKRNTEGVFYVYSVILSYPVKPGTKGCKVSIYKDRNVHTINLNKKRKLSPIIVGSGPSGLFCALYLAKMGYAPIVFERGEDIRNRVKTVKKFFENGILNLNSNVQFGLGGAGTFSDGKINSRIKNPLKTEVLETFVKCGAPRDIMYLNKPHLGTDKLRVIVEDLKALIEYYGGRFYFNSVVTDLIIKDNAVKGVIVNDDKEYISDCVVLAVGNGARDTFNILGKNNVNMTNKSFALGFRVEHLREEIDRCCYGKFAGHKVLGAADYNLTYHDDLYKKGVYSFCNCPGGVVVAGASGEGQVVTNGMSFRSRNMTNTNSAIVVNVNESDYGSDLFAGIRFQEALEHRAFEMGGGNYNAPYMSIRDFLGIKGKTNVTPSYLPGVKECDMNELLPENLTLSIKSSFEYFNKFFDTFYNGVITGVESRTSSPVRILRNKLTLESENIKGLYPVGEGAGYAGGILSSAVDGIKAAIVINDNN